MRVIFASMMIVFASFAPAAAEIAIKHARYAGGVLVVSGVASRPNQRVSLNGRFTTSTDQNQRFTFRLAYRPRGCRIDIRAGSENREAVVANCSRRPGREHRFHASPGGPEWRLKMPRPNDSTSPDGRPGEIWRERPIR